MVDATPSATPMPAQPVATVTNPAAPFPPADPLPVFVPPSVMDPVSNLDFLPVDDAFALEFRSETIEQLVGGDALRRGVSERIEAGRSHTNADLVAGRDRVRVHATLHEHTGHGLAEQAAHLHTTVDGTLDVHAASEDTVLLAGHMRDLWDGGAAIVAAMTDDTVAGGGIRVTAPLDLWVHALMGVEERIGTCTADAVLMESSATHYEREYGPGAHAAGLAVYSGSLYQSSRSTFRPLMRVSSGVRNLIAGGDGGGGGGGGDAGAGSAPGVSPPPVPARTGAAQESVTGTLAAGRTTAATPATAFDTADALTDTWKVPLEELVNPVDARATEGTGEAGIVMRAENLPELTRSTGTAEQLGALQETLRLVATESASEASGGSWPSGLDGAVSKLSATGGGGPLEITPPSAIYGETVAMARPHPGVRPHPRGSSTPRPRVGSRADDERRTPRGRRPSAPVDDAAVRLSRGRSQIAHACKLLPKPRRSGKRPRFSSVSFSGIDKRVQQLFTQFGGQASQLHARLPDWTLAIDAYAIVRKTASQADSGSDVLLANALRESLLAINKHADDAWKAVAEGVRHRRRPDRPEAWATAGDDRTACDSPGHPAADAHSHGIRLGLQLQAVARPVQRLQEQ